MYDTVSMEDTKRGRPTKFNETIKEKILELAALGKTDIQIADIIGVSERTLNNWKGNKPKFLQSLKESKQVADELVEASLFARAVGYKEEYKKQIISQGEVVEFMEVNHMPPDTTAAIFWLKNRQPENWRDKTEVEVNDLRKKSDEELEARLAELRAKQETKEES